MSGKEISATSTGSTRRKFLGHASATAAGMMFAGVVDSVQAKPAQPPSAAVFSGSGGDLTSWSARALSTAIRSKAVSCVEVMQAYLAHIDRFNPKFNTIVSRPDSDQLLAEAKRLDSELARGHYRGWMHGFPHAIKDLADAQGLITTMGSPILKSHVAEHDSIFVERIRRAGAIFIGKTNVPEFGLGSQSYNPVFGATLNAYDGVSTAGGSSGGAAAALALQLLPMADGSDMMGSLRNPAAFNNIIGFRPTPGLVPEGSDFVEQLPSIGPMARNVEDAAMLLSTMAGQDPHAPGSVHSNPAQFLQPLKKDFNGSRVGWLGNLGGYLPMEEGVMSLSSHALNTFTDIGCELDDTSINFPMAKLWECWLTLRHWIIGGKLSSLYQNPQTRALIKPEAVWEIEGSLRLSGDDVYQASMARAEFYRALLGCFEQFDYLVLPSAQVFPFDANVHWPKQIAGKTMDTYHRWMEVVIIGTLSGCPVINVPAGFGKNGLPMGLQIIAPRHQDFDLLQFAYAYEQSSRWNLDYVPPVLR